MLISIIYMTAAIINVILMIRYSMYMDYYIMIGSIFGLYILYKWNDFWEINKSKFPNLSEKYVLTFTIVTCVLFWPSCFIYILIMSIYYKINYKR